jgi:hypothetical protein
MDAIPDLIREREDALAAMLTGQWEGVSADAAAAGVEAANEERTGGYAGRAVGFGVIAEKGAGDGIEFLVAITDGTRQGAIRARLTGTRAAVLRNTGVDAREHIVERLRNAALSLPNDGNRYLNMILQEQPITFS